MMAVKKNAPLIETFEHFFELIPFCPEVEIGLGIPRNPIHLVRINNRVRCVEINNPTLDVTDALSQVVYQQKNLLLNLNGYIFKKNSPSCGLKNVNVLVDNLIQQDGTGIFAKELTTRYPLLPVEEEHRLENISIRRNFYATIHDISSVETFSLL